MDQVKKTIRDQACRLSKTTGTIRVIYPKQNNKICGSRRNLEKGRVVLQQFNVKLNNGIRAYIRLSQGNPDEIVEVHKIIHKSYSRITPIYTR